MGEKVKYAFGFARRKVCNHVDNLEEKLFFVNTKCRIIEHTNGKFRVNVNCECIGEACHCCADTKEIELLYCYQK